MRKTLIFSWLILLCGQIVWAQKTDSALNEVVATEKAFAAAAADKGTRTAFLEFAASDGIVFSTKPENAREYWTKHPEYPGLLAWSPAWADVSADGNLGYTTGSWEFRPKGKTDAPVAWGDYFTIWKKQPDGKWKFELDLGISHPSSEISTTWKPSATAKKNNPAQSAAAWETVELKFSEILRTERASGVYQKLSSDNIHLLRDGYLPILGKKTALEQIPKENLTLKTRALGGGGGTDFVYSYGEYWQVQDGKNERGYFARVWKREPKGWRIALDVAHALPPDTK